jgi:prepilin-type processing-associated H-X9-DG protein
MRQIGLATQMYVTDRGEGVLPFSFYNSNASGGHVPPEFGYPAANSASWADPPVLGDFLGEAYTTYASLPASARRSVARCPADAGIRGPNSASIGLSTGLCWYTNAVGPSGMSTFAVPIAKATRTAETILATDSHEWRWMTQSPTAVPNAGNCVPADPSVGLANFGWVAPPAIYTWTQWSRRHRKGANLLFLDGHVRWSADIQAEFTAGTVRLRAY